MCVCVYVSVRVLSCSVVTYNGEQLGAIKVLRSCRSGQAVLPGCCVRHWRSCCYCTSEFGQAYRYNIPIDARGDGNNPKEEKSSYQVRCKLIAILDFPQAFSHRDLASAFSNALGREVQYVQVPYEDAKKAFMGNGFPEWQVDGILELYKRIDAGKYDYESSLPKLLNREPLSYTQWVDSVKRGFQ